MDDALATLYDSPRDIDPHRKVMRVPLDTFPRVKESRDRGQGLASVGVHEGSMRGQAFSRRNAREPKNRQTIIIPMATARPSYMVLLA